MLSAHHSTQRSLHVPNVENRLSKLVGLFIKTLAKPMAKSLKNQLVKHPITRRALISVGQTSHAISTRMTIWSSGYKVRSITPLEEEVALVQAAESISETFIFAVSGGVVVYEYHRSSEKERIKEEQRLKKITDEASRLQAKLMSLDKRLEALEEYAKTNSSRAIVLGPIGIGGAPGGYKEPDGKIPILDEDDDSNAKTKTSPKLADHSLVMNSSNTSQQSRRWWWPY